MKSQITFSPKGYIEVHQPRIIVLNEVVALAQVLVNLITRVEDEGKAVKILVDGSDVEEWGPNVITFYRTLFKDLKFEKMAIFGASDKIRLDREKLISELGLTDKMRVFKKRGEAVGWLES